MAHTTPSMCFGYMATSMKKPKVIKSHIRRNNLKLFTKKKSYMSRMPEDNKSDESVVISSYNINFNDDLCVSTDQRADNEPEYETKRQKLDSTN